MRNNKRKAKRKGKFILFLIIIGICFSKVKSSMLILNTAGAATVGAAVKTYWPQLANIFGQIIYDKGKEILSDEKKRNDLIDNVNKKTSSMRTSIREWYYSWTESGREKLRKES